MGSSRSDSWGAYGGRNSPRSERRAKRGADRQGGCGAASHERSTEVNAASARLGRRRAHRPGLRARPVAGGAHRGPLGRDPRLALGQRRDRLRGGGGGLRLLRHALLLTLLLEEEPEQRLAQRRRVEPARDVAVEAEAEL